MWLFTDTGFVSAVQHRDNPELLVVRARDRLSLEPLAYKLEAPITSNALSDYPYRVIINRADFASWVEQQADEISYGNFKDQVAVTRGKKFASILSGVWSRMLDAEDDEAHELRRNHDRAWSLGRA